MKIENYIVSENFEELAVNSLHKRDKASKVLTDVENAIRQGIKTVDIEYYEAYLDYMVTDNEHMKTFLDYLKVAYDNFNIGKNIVSINKRREVEDLQLQTKNAFDEYYKYYEILSLNQEILKVAVGQYQSVDFSKTPFALLELHKVLEECDRTHITVHTLVENLRDKTMPILDKCESLFFPEEPENECFS